MTIYKNIFNGLSEGNRAVGMNRDLVYDDHGLEYQCNINIDNNIDFIVTGSVLPSSMIRGRMGEVNLTAGNTFSSGADWHFTNEGYQDIKYYYCDNCTSDQEPIYYCTDPNSVDCYFEPIPKLIENGCLSHYGGGSGEERSLVLTPEQKLDTEQEFLQNLNDYNSVKTLYESLKDGGNTEVLKTDVETSWPQDMWELRAELLGKSPHLSKEVLMTAADKTDVLPESVLFEILSANPDELNDKELIDYLENKEEPLPAYMISILRQVSGNTTYKTVLLNEMAAYHTSKSKAAQDIIRSILNDTDFDAIEYRNWLDNLGGINADKQIIASYIEEGNYTDAQILLDLVPSLYNLAGDGLQKYNDYKQLTTWQMDLTQQGRSFFDLDNQEIEMLANYAEHENSEAGNMARGILEYAYGYHFCDCLLPSGQTGQKSSSEAVGSSMNNSGLSIETSPNPAKSWVSFNYSLPTYIQEATLEVSDVNGRIVATFMLDQSRKQKVWDIRKIKPGTYIYSLKNGQLTESGKLIIK